MQRAEIERLGDALYLAMCDRRMLAPLTDSHPNLTIEQAYEISLCFLANRFKRRRENHWQENRRDQCGGDGHAGCATARFRLHD